MLEPLVQTSFWPCSLRFLIVLCYWNEFARFSSCAKFLVIWKWILSKYLGFLSYNALNRPPALSFLCVSDRFIATSIAALSLSLSHLCRMIWEASLLTVGEHSAGIGLPSAKVQCHIWSFLQSCKGFGVLHSWSSSSISVWNWYKSTKADWVNCFQLEPYIF